ncbi:SDR family NAD(P)-dependent oxidoreductase [Duganella sp. BJB488]|uniref:oxidoreductase n=1 Tax=unclassified Duganella TaxID=2636909 RepID=UPI000E3481CF|nr:MULTISPECIES: oxidoreductase [unclassified Duganella]RFP26220.1 SDR family NAD(P)-dependent oxidoreductase [Duganella sp. BJB489]RFP28039.1 SDR family NAD(P)-dependent oxidoreductase [Duganella sp. BJB488]RFP37152.1 SDR family NAD(P)-dependent oxidoreductase [Duganella sp. BJB480]
MAGTAQKVWFITGASRGFGLLTAQQALARGDFVVATARDPLTVTAALGDHPNLLALRLDVRLEAQAVTAVQQALARFGRIDVLVNNAGYGLLGAVEEASAEEVRALYDTNVFGLLNVTRAALPAMRKRGGGHVINLSSVGGYTAFPGWGLYSSTKFAVEGLSEALAMELAPLGIHVTVVEPGFFRTDFLDASSLATTHDRIDAYAATVGAMREFAAGVNHKQPGDPAKLAGALLQLADSAQPPVRLQLGSDTVERVRAKNLSVEAEMAQWLELAVSTDFDTLQKAA